MIQTTKLLVRVSTPRGEPAMGASVSARLTATGVSSNYGYVDRSHVTATANEEGVAELSIWPNTAGLSNATYHIVARGSDGGKLIDGMVSVPESAVGVWLHDIVMTEPPTAKPYDEESIQIIQQARIESAAYADQSIQARDSSQAYAIEVAANIAAAQELRVSIGTSLMDASESARLAGIYSQDSKIYSESAAEAMDSAADIVHEVELSADLARDAAQSALNIFSGAQSVADAVYSAEESATASAANKDQSNTAKLAAQASAQASLEAAGIANTRAESARISADTAVQAKNSANADRLAVAQDRSAVTLSATKVAEDRLLATQAASTATSAATTSLNRSAALIDHAETMRIQINASKVAAEDARTGAEALFGDLTAIDEAVQLTYANRAIVDVALSNNLIILRPR